MEITDNNFYVSEIFESIQGEGNFSGVYCLFVRFHFCNLTCHWCDTKYTWNQKSGKFNLYNAEELKNIISNSKAHHIVFTGGEPCIYRLDKLITEGKKFHVESNGCFIPIQALQLLLNDGTLIKRAAMDNIVYNFNWVVSAKLSNSYQAFPHESFGWWVNFGGSIFKFIISTPDDLAEVDSLTSRYNIEKHRIYIGIEGFTLTSQLQPNIVEQIIKHGYNFSPRLHVMLWGAKRGK